MSLASGDDCAGLHLISVSLHWPSSYALSRADRVCSRYLVKDALEDLAASKKKFTA